MAGAFAGGEGDFTTAFEPTGTQMEEEGTGYIVTSVGDYKRRGREYHILLILQLKLIWQTMKM